MKLRVTMRVSIKEARNRGAHIGGGGISIHHTRQQGAPSQTAPPSSPPISTADLLELKVKTFYHLLSPVFLLIRLLSKIGTPHELENDFLILLRHPHPLDQKDGSEAFRIAAHLISSSKHVC